MNEEFVLLCFLSGLILIGNVASAYENIALNRPSWQQYPFSTSKWGADKAVDGSFTDRSANGNQCTLSTNFAETATLRVDLEEILSIHHLTIYYRTDNILWGPTNGYTSRFLGFSVYISNTTNTHEGILCFKDTNYTRATIPNVTTIECVTHGRYAIYYNERLRAVTYPDGYSSTAFNELCEFEVYGCRTPGVYGENCDLPCPQNCQEGHCNIVDGACLGCVVGYKGPRCEEQCDNNKYGLECNLICGNCSNGEQCNHVNGSCPNGCDPGVQGHTCDDVCPYGRHGKNCVEVCKPNCRGGCNRFTGVCESGCYPGWKGTFCEDECYARMYGENCNQSCGSCLNFEQCHHINGTCLNGCDRGFQGDKCTEVCHVGRYGYNCKGICNINCGVRGRCNRETGQCEGGCLTGWKGLRCDQKCDDGNFGLNCAQSCGFCFGNEQCHFMNGTCLNGCDKGYQGVNCIQECLWGFHGYECNETCSTECFNRTCDAITGACPQVAIKHSQKTNNAPIIGGVTTAIIVSLTVVIAAIVCRSRKGQCKGLSNQEKNTKQLSKEHATPTTDIYDKIDDNRGYLELGPRTNISDKIGDIGGYQELGPGRDISDKIGDNGEYQELGPNKDVYDKIDDNGGYQELGQFQSSLYDQ